MNELIVKYKVATCHYTEAICHVIAYRVHRVLSIIITDLQLTTSNRAIYPLDKN